MEKPPPTSHLRESWLLFFFLGAVMLNYPFLQIFNKTATVLGIPLLVFYFLLGWPASILVIYLFSRRLSQQDNAIDGREKGEE